MEHALGVAGVAITTATTDDDGPRCRLPIEAQLRETNGAARIYARKFLDFYKVAPGLVPWLWRHMREFDVVHIHALFSFVSVVAGLTARWLDVPYVVRPLGTLTTYCMRQRRPRLKRLSLRLLEERILRHAAAVHFTSKREFQEAAALDLPFRGVIIPLAVELGLQGAPEDLVRDYPVLKGRRVVLYLSRLDPKKNLEGLLGAFAALRPQRTNIALLVAGSGEPAYVANLERLAQTLGIKECVVWLGHVNGTRKAAALAVSDLFVLPSFSENFGLAAAEALLTGLPCVLSRGVAIAAQVESSGAGLVVEPEPEAIARAVERLLSDENLRRKMGESGRQLAQREYSAATMAARLVALYQSVAKRKEPT
jgi:glycosyltransferase involved in cell wall biosynthesis